MADQVNAFDREVDPRRRRREVPMVPNPNERPGVIVPDGRGRSPFDDLFQQVQRQRHSNAFEDR